MGRGFRKGVGGGSTSPKVVDLVQSTQEDWSYGGWYHIGDSSFWAINGTIIKSTLFNRSSGWLAYNHNIKIKSNSAYIVLQGTSPAYRPATSITLYIRAFDESTQTWGGWVNLGGTTNSDTFSIRGNLNGYKGKIIQVRYDGYLSADYSSVITTTTFKVYT